MPEQITWDYLERTYGLKPIRGGSGEGDGDASSDASGTGETGDSGTSESDDAGSAGDDLAGLKTALAAERTARKTAEKERKAFEARLRAIEDKDKSEVERLTGERDALKVTYDQTLTALRSERAARLVIGAATKANAIRPDAVVHLINGGLEYDDDGQPTNVDAAVAQAKKDYPELFRASAGSGDGGRSGATPPAGAETMNQMIRRAAGRAG